MLLHEWQRRPLAGCCAMNLCGTQRWHAARAGQRFVWRCARCGTEQARIIQNQPGRCRGRKDQP